MELGPLFIDIAGIELAAEDRERLLHPLVGGVIVFARNYQSMEQVKQLIRSIRSLRNPELLISVDQEGGRVQRLKVDFFRLPPAARFGSLYEHNPKRAVSSAQAAGYIMASELLDIGVDFSFAPVLDVDQTMSEAIGDRSFHSDPKVVTMLADAFITGMNTAGMVATGKHFPGHGGVVEDSHYCLPCDERTLSSVNDCDLVPYRVLLNKLRAIMTAHVQFKEIDTELATFSKFWLGEILRKRLGFDGLVFSDDLVMAGAHIEPDPVQRALRALVAGCDALLLCNSTATVDTILDGLTLDEKGHNHQNQIRTQRLTGMKGGAVAVESAAREKALDQLSKV